MLTLQLKVYGQHGILGDLVLVHVIVMQKEPDHATLQEVICLALAMQLRKEAVQV